MKLTSLKITPKLGILVGVTLIGLCVAGVLAGYLMKREMLNARMDQTRAIVDMGLNLAAGLKKEVDAGKMTKEAAIAEFGKRGNTLTYDKGNGYLFGTRYQGITVMAPNPAQIGQNRLDVVTNGRYLSRELLEGVKKNGEILLTYEYMKPGTEKPIRKIGYAVAVPGFDMYVGTGAYLDDIDEKMAPIAWLLGLAILGIAIIAGSIAWMIGRSISKPLGQLGTRMQDLADGKLDGEIPGLGRGDEIGAMAATVQIFKDNAVRIRGLEQAEAETQKRAAGRAPRGDGKHRQRFRAHCHRHRPFGLVGCDRHAEHGAIDDGDRQRRQRPRRHGGCCFRKRLQQCRHRRGCGGRALQLGCGNFPPGGALQRDRQQGGRRCRAHQLDGAGSVHRRRKNRRGREAHSQHRGADQPAGAQRHHRGGARRRIRPRLCGGRFRSEGAGQPDCESDRRNFRAGGGDAGFHQRGGELDRRHQPDHCADERDHGHISTSIDQQGDATREIARNIQSVAAGSSEINANIGSVTSAASATGKAAGDVLSSAKELDNQSGMLRNAVDEFLAKVRAA